MLSNACSPSENQAAGIAYIFHSSLPVWVFGLDSRKLFEMRLRHFKHFCLNIQFVYSADAFFKISILFYFFPNFGIVYKVRSLQKSALQS